MGEMTRFSVRSRLGPIQLAEQTQELGAFVGGEHAEQLAFGVEPEPQPFVVQPAAPVGNHGEARPPIARIRGAADQAVRFEAVHQLRHVRFDARQPIGELTERQRVARLDQLMQGRQLRERQTNLAQPGIHATLEDPGRAQDRKELTVFESTHPFRYILCQSLTRPATRADRSIFGTEEGPMPSGSSRGRSRRVFLQLSAAASAALVACRSKGTPAVEPSALGQPIRAYGARSRFETAKRLFRRTDHPEASSSFTPLAATFGIITPSALHFERHHGGVPDLDPAVHTLTLHGLVDRPLVFTVDELKRFPSLSRINFLECSGNTGSEWRGAGATEVQRSHGLTSCSEWTGVPLATLLRECGVQPAGTWILAEGADACKMTRSIPIAKALDDVMVAYAQNGEPLRPEQGYPLRLIVPGWEGNINVKWIRRIEVLDQPAMSREETSKYTDLLADGTARQFTFVNEAKSVITRPSGGEKLPGPGVYELTGLAWSGRGAITRVEVSADGGATWTDATLQQPVLPRAHTRFCWSWRWEGRPARLQSRCTDETGYVQPTREALVAVRGYNSNYHNNAIQIWKVAADGSVTNGNG